MNMIYESIVIIEDCRFHKIGATKSLKDLFEVEILTEMLINGE